MPPRQTWNLAHSPLEEIWEHMISKTTIHKSPCVCMCVCIHTGTRGGRAAEDKCSRHVRSKSPVCVDKWRQCCSQSMVPDPLGGYCKVKATFTCVDICSDGAKATRGNIAGAFERIKEWHVTILVVTVFPKAMHSPFKKKSQFHLRTSLMQ